jgi:hypothetical protein
VLSAEADSRLGSCLPDELDSEGERLVVLRSRRVALANQPVIGLCGVSRRAIWLTANGRAVKYECIAMVSSVRATVGDVLRLPPLAESKHASNRILRLSPHEKSGPLWVGTLCRSLRQRQYSFDPQAQDLGVSSTTMPVRHGRASIQAGRAGEKTEDLTGGRGEGFVVQRTVPACDDTWLDGHRCLKPARTFHDPARHSVAGV